MKNHTVLFRYGHFYDQETGKRIVLKEGAEYALLGEDADFPKVDPYNEPHQQIASHEAQLEELCREPEMERFALLLPRGAELDFKIGHSRHKGERENSVSRFRVRLEEDLFLYRKKKWKETTEPSLWKCACTVFANPSEDIEFFEWLYATSLNNAFEKVCIFYFKDLRSPTTNAFNDFHYNGIPLGGIRTQTWKNQ